MQELSIIRQATVPFIVHFGSNNCKIKNMKTMDGTNYNTESFKILENIYKQEVISEPFNEFDIVADNQDSIQKQLYYEAYVEPVIKKLEAYIEKNYGTDKILRQILNEIKLEFTVNETYLLDYYTNRNFIKQEKEENDTIKSKNKANIKIFIGDSLDITASALENAELELNINKDVTIMVHLMPKSIEDATALLTTLANFVKSGKLENTIKMVNDATLIKVYIHKDNEVTYIVYDEYDNVIEKNTTKVIEQQQTLLSFIESILIFIYKVKLFTIAAAGGILLFAIAMLKSFSSGFAEKIAKKVYDQISNLSIKSMYFEDELKRKSEDAMKLHNLAKPFIDKTNNNSENSDNITVKDIVNNLTPTSTNTIPSNRAIILIYAIIANVILLFIAKLLGLTIFYQSVLFLLLLLHGIEGVIFTTPHELIAAAYYVAVNFKETFKIFIKDTSIAGIMEKGLLIMLFVAAILQFIRLKREKQKANAPSPDRLLTEIQAKFK